MSKPIEMLLPPHWTKKTTGGKVIYVNEISGEESAEHPFTLFSRNFQNRDVTAEPNPTTEESISRDDNVIVSTNKNEIFEYHCQWTERDVHGDVTVYGITIRMQRDGCAFVKFDGIDASWEFATLEGPYGALDLHDLFVGAKVTIFGRHFTISAVNALAARFISKEKKRLLTQQEDFRRRIECVGATPCVARRDREGVISISRGGKLDEQTNLRALLKENARLGEQLAQLGLARQK